MPSICSVPLCGEKGGHTFPKNDKIRKKWVIAIKRVDENNRNKLWVPSDRDVVCYDHFLPTDYKITDKIRRLKPTTVPSIFSFKPKPKERSERLKGTSGNQEATPSLTEEPMEELFEFEDGGFDLKQEEIVEEECCEIEMVTDELNVNIMNEVETTKIPDFVPLSIFQFQTNDKAIQFYTSFDNFLHFNMFYDVLGLAVNHLQPPVTCLQPIDQLFLFLIKLRQAKEDVELSVLFGISETTVSKIVNIWTNFLYFQLKEIPIWTNASVNKEYMPETFTNTFPTTRVILDATEIPIEKPGNVNAQSLTFSSYKNKNTVKVMVGINPKGLVTYVSEAYAGSTSDRQIIEHSELYLNCEKYFDKGDSIMADRGIMVQDLFASNDVFVNTPTMLRGKSQLEPEEVIKDRKVASQRVHVERVIGLGKTYKILTKTMSCKKVPLSSRIIFICFFMSNFRSAIVDAVKC